MTLDTSKLASAIELLCNELAASRLYGNSAKAAERWAAAMAAYAADVVPISTTVEAAAQALQTDLAVAFAKPWSESFGRMESAFSAFGAAVALGMASAFDGTGPPGEVGFGALLATRRHSRIVAAERVADAIALWMATGQAIPASGGAAVTWQ